MAALLATRGVDISDAETVALEGLAVWRIFGDRRGEADALYVLALVEDQRSHWEAATKHYKEQLRIWREVGDDYGTARVLMVLGGMMYKHGDIAGARAAEQEAIAIFRTAGDRRREAFCLCQLAMFAAVEGSWVEAARGYRESLLAFIEVRDASFVLMALVGLAATAAELGRSDAAVRLLGATDGQLRRSDARLLASDLAKYVRTVGLCRQTLREEQFANACQFGQDLSRTEWIVMADEVVEAARDLALVRHDPSARVGSGLTTREHDVLRLLVEGRSNAQIADALFVGVGTVKTHVANILAKLGVPTRAAAATRAVRQGLI
jgi:DNA-binding CsgD family transcriptional regulator